MAFQTFDFIIKLYINPAFLPLTTTTLRFENGDFLDYNDVLFPTNGIKRLVQVSAQCFPLSNGVLIGNIQNEPILPKWSFYGPYKTGFNTFNQYMKNIPAPNIIETGGAPSVAIFEIPYPRLYMSSENPVYEPVCMFCEGWSLDQLYFYLGASATFTQSYWGRLVMQFTFDID